MSGEANGSTRILFVDDSKVMLKTASKILGTEFDVVTAVDGDDAWAKLERDPEIRVLFSDINMPGTDGYGLLSKVRSADKLGLHDLPVILVTGAEEDESAARQQALDRGATDFLSKKFLSTELLPRARAHAKYQRITVQLQAQSTLDPLTGLTNESGFLSHLEQDIAYARRHRSGLAVMRVQIDDLVATFQEHGNAVVERIVVHVSQLIRARIRGEDTAAHIGLSGFAISLPGGQLDGIEAMAASLRAQAASTELEADGQWFHITLSTAVMSTDQGAWASAQEALDRCQALLDRTRQRTPVRPAQRAVEPPQPARTETQPSLATTRVPEPATAAKTPARDALRPEPVRDTPRRVQDQQVPAKAPNVLQRVMAALRLFGATQGARLARFFKKLVGK